MLAIKVNTNEVVRVRLTDLGKRILQHRAEIFKLVNPKFEPEEFPEDSDGYTEIQLWTLMNIFGQYLNIATNPPFDTNIEIILPDKRIKDGTLHTT